MKLNKYLTMNLVVTLISVNAMALKINLASTGNMNTTQINKIKQVEAVANQVLNSPELKERVLNFSYQNKGKTVNGFYQNNGLTNLQVYEQLMAGAEQYPKPTPANALADMYLKIYYPPFYKRWNGVNAFTNQNDQFLHFYAKYYARAGIAELTNTLVHEWTHKMGFDHDYNATTLRPYSVPYGIGNIIEDLATKYIGQ